MCSELHLKINYTFDSFHLEINEMKFGNLINFIHSFHLVLQAVKVSYPCLEVKEKEIERHMKLSIVDFILTKVT